MALIKGPFTIEWGANPILQVEEIETNYEQDSEEYQTVQHQTYELDGSMKASVSLTLLATDITALAIVLPQYYVAQGELMSTGETVNSAEGAIDLFSSCDDDVYDDLDIASCANPAQIFRLKNARTKLDSVEFDGKIRKVVVKFIGQAEPGDGVVQFFAEGGLTPPAS